MEPFVKWAGGKRQLLDRLTARLPKKYNRYYEPFVGAGALFLHLQPKKATINDINEQLINCYREIRENPAELIERVNELDAGTRDKATYLENRGLYNAHIMTNTLNTETAALMIWLNKNCFNGLYRTNRCGLFNVPFNNKEGGRSINEENIMALSTYLRDNDIDVFNGDFERACKDCKKGDFIFFDSPYVPVSNTAGFVDYTKESFKEDDHRRLARLFAELTERGCYCMLTNSNTELVWELYKDYKIEVVNVNRAINADASKRKGKEVIVVNYEY